jgi:hypothetical protein
MIKNNIKSDIKDKNINNTFYKIKNYTNYSIIETCNINIKNEYETIQKITKKN